MRLVALLGLVLALCGPSFAADSTVCGQGLIRDHSGFFLFKPRAAHFSNRSVVVAPKNNFDPAKNTNNIASLRLYATRKSGGTEKSWNCTLKSTGVCPGWKECLNAPSYLCPLTGYQLKSNYKDVHFRFTYKKRINSQIDGLAVKASCEDFYVQAPQCRTPCNPISIKRPGEYHDPRCSLSYPACLSRPEKASAF